MKLKKASHEQWIGRTLRAGVWLSGGLLLTGLVMELFRNGGSVRQPGNLTFSQFFDALAGGADIPAGELVLYGGILVLVLTPVVRVLSTGITFGIEKDWKFVAVSSAIFAVLMAECIISFL